MKHLFKLFFILTIANKVFAEDLKTKTLTKAEQNFISNFNPEIFSLSKKKESAFDSPSATYVLSSEDIRRSGATSIPEALRLIPGLQVAKMNGNTYAISIRGFNRQFSNKLLVMIDGRTIYTNLFSGVVWDIHDYVIEDIDKIEVVRGPGGAIWGANAVNGVINIITKNAIQTKGFYGSQIVGNQDKSITEVRYGGTTSSRDDYRIYAKKTLRDGVDRYNDKVYNEDGIRQERAGFRYDISSIKDNNISLHGDIFESVAENYFTTLPNLEKNDGRSKGANLVANWTQKISNVSSFSLNGYVDHNSFDIPVLERSDDTLDIDFQHFYNFTNHNKFIWGVGYRQIRDKINANESSPGIIPIDYQPRKRNDQLWTLFLQDKMEFTESLSLTIGSKLEKNDFTGFEYQPNARLTFFPSRNQTLWASVSQAVRTPTRGEDDVDLKSGKFTVNKGSDVYESEKLLAYEVGYRVKPNHQSMIDFSSFYNQYSKLRTFENESPKPPIASNLGYGESYGFEILGKWQVTNKMRLEGSYEYMKMDLNVSKQSTDNYSIIGKVDSLKIAEGQFPQSQVKLRSFYNISPKLEFDNIFYYVDNLPSGSGNSIGSKGIPSYVRFDTRIGYLLTKNFDVSLGVQNILDQRHREFRPSVYNRTTEVGRTIYLKASLHY